MGQEITVVAFYLPQFHPIPENDEWWGPGFTEWTNVAKARPLFKGHYQPKIPADLGFYDLRVPETREHQARLARDHGVTAFCYWHYWFGDGRRLLERPFDEVLSSGKPDFPFCLAWANSSWKGFDYGCDNERNLLIEQRYPGEADYAAHFAAVLPAFRDSRYLRIDGKPVFFVFQPRDLPDPRAFIDQWNRHARESGLDGIFFIAQTDRVSDIQKYRDLGFDAVNLVRLFDAYNKGVGRIKRRVARKLGLPKIVPYERAIDFLTGPEDEDPDCFPTVYPNWDHSARSGKRALILHKSTPALFARHLRDAIARVIKKPEGRRVIFIKSWNEWAEGNYLEPDTVNGHGYLEALRDELRRS